MQPLFNPQTQNKTNRTQQVLYYADLLCKKIDLHVDAFIKRIEARRLGDKNRAEFIEEMMLKPLDKQIVYLAQKTQDVLKGDEYGSE